MERDYNKPMRNNPALPRFVAAACATTAAPVFAHITKTTTIQG
jgi:hypothetical protein